MQEPSSDIHHHDTSLFKFIIERDFQRSSEDIEKEPDRHYPTSHHRRCLSLDYTEPQTLQQSPTHTIGDGAILHQPLLQINEGSRGRVCRSDGHISQGRTSPNSWRRNSTPPPDIGKLRLKGRSKSDTDEDFQKAVQLSMLLSKCMAPLRKTYNVSYMIFQEYMSSNRHIEDIKRVAHEEGRYIDQSVFADLILQWIIGAEEEHSTIASTLLSRVSEQFKADTDDQRAVIDLLAMRACYYLLAADSDDDVLQVVFDMYDHDHDGYLHREEVENMVTSLFIGVRNLLCDSARDPSAYGMPNVPPLSEDLLAYLLETISSQMDISKVPCILDEATSHANRSAFPEGEADFQYIPDTTDPNEDTPLLLNVSDVKSSYTLMRRLSTLQWSCFGKGFQSPSSYVEEKIESIQLRATKSSTL